MTRDQTGSAAFDPLRIAIELLRARLGEAVRDVSDPGASELIDLLELAASHGVTAALAGGLRSLMEPSPTWRQLEAFLEAPETQNRRRNTQLLAAARKYANILTAGGIHFVFLKGLATLLADPDALAWRQVSDIDVAVPEDQVTRAADILKAAGLVQAEDLAGYHLGLHHHFPALVDDDTGTFIELHVRLMQNPADDPVSQSELLGAAATVRNEETLYSIPAVTHRMMHLIAHAQVSDWGYTLRNVKLGHLLEATLLARQAEVNWLAIRTAFQRIGLEPELLGFLIAAQQLLGLPWPYKDAPGQRDLRWAALAITALSRGEPTWRRAPRILRRYLKEVRRDPRRLYLISSTLMNSTRRGYLTALNRDRLKPGR